MEPEKPVEHPMKIVRGGPLFSTKHEATDRLLRLQQAGHIRRCAHAKVVPLDDERAGVRLYTLRCEENSFRLEVLPLQPPAYAGQPQIVFHGCPPGCRLFRSAARQRIVNLGTWLRAPLQTFGRQQWQVKVAVLLAPLWAFLIYRGPETIRALTELVKAVLGK
jgi:hypothetical protein